MNIQTFHSSSAGNLYRIDDLLIDPGVPIKTIKRCLDYNLSSITACLCTHGHLDHTRGVKALMAAGIDCYMTRGTAIALEYLEQHRLHIIKAGEQFQVGKWTIKPFETVHNADEPVGFLLGCGNEKTLYAIDTRAIPYRFRRLTHLLIECNYEMAILRHNLYTRKLDPELAKITINNHMELGAVKRFLHRQDLSLVREIHLLHLSAQNSDAERFKREIEELTGRPIYIGRE